MTEAERIALANEITAARKGDNFEQWQKDNIERLRAAVDSIRTKRQEWRAPEKAARSSSKKSTDTGAKATVQQLSWRDLGF